MKLDDKELKGRLDKMLDDGLKVLPEQERLRELQEKAWCSPGELEEIRFLLSRKYPERTTK